MGEVRAITISLYEQGKQPTKWSYDPHREEAHHKTLSLREDEKRCRKGVGKTVSVL